MTGVQTCALPISIDQTVSTPAQRLHCNPLFAKVEDRVTHRGARDAQRFRRMERSVGERAKHLEAGGTHEEA